MQFHIKKYYFILTTVMFWLCFDDLNTTWITKPRTVKCVFEDPRGQGHVFQDSSTADRVSINECTQAIPANNEIWFPCTLTSLVCCYWTKNIYFKNIFARHNEHYTWCLAVAEKLQCSKLFRNVHSLLKHINSTQYVSEI